MIHYKDFNRSMLYCNFVIRLNVTSGIS